MGLSFKFITLLIIDLLHIYLWLLLRQFILLFLQQHLLHILCYLLIIWRFLFFIVLRSTKLTLWTLLDAVFLFRVLYCRPIHVSNHWIIFNGWRWLLHQFWNATLSSAPFPFIVRNLKYWVTLWTYFGCSVRLWWLMHEIIFVSALLWISFIMLLHNNIIHWLLPLFMNDLIVIFRLFWLIITAFLFANGFFTVIYLHIPFNHPYSLSINGRNLFFSLFYAQL